MKKLITIAVLLTTIAILLMQERFIIEWIDVSQRLPSKSGDYLVSNGEGIAVTFFNKVSQKWNESSVLGEGVLLDFWQHEEITHWHPLPLSPYQIGLHKRVGEMS